jgi:SsrA-binding protein
MNKRDITISVNKKARFNYEILDTYIAGIVLTGTEIKSIRDRKVNINESYCYFKDNELYVKQMHIAKYKFGNIYNHDEYNIRKLLLNKREILKIQNKMDIGISIIPLELFISKNGFAKLEIAMVKGKKLYDKRRTIKERELKRKLRDYRF